MIIAIDVYYSENEAKSVGVMFENWEDCEPTEIIESYTKNPQDYEPGFFYKRELLYITSVGVDLQTAALNIGIMHGKYQFPYLLKLLDQYTKEDKK